MEIARRTVLVVEDDAALRRLIALTLSDAGIDCVVAHDAEDGLEKAFSPDVGAAVLDLNLPGMSGAELAWRLGLLAPDTQVIAISGHMEDWDAGDLKDLGIARIFSKPFDVDVLVAALRDLLRDSGDAGPEKHRSHGSTGGSQDRMTR